MTTVEIAHELTLEQARQRLEEVARKHDVRLTPDAGGLQGSVERPAGFLGTVRGRYQIEAARILLTITEAPAFLPASTLRRMLEEELGPAFGRG